MYGKVIDRDKWSYDYKMWQKIMFYKQYYIYIKGIQRCLKWIWDQVLDLDDESGMYGVYGGIFFRDLQLQIDIIIKNQYFRVCCLRKIEKLLFDGKMDGWIMNIKELRGMLEVIINWFLFLFWRERGMILYFKIRRLLMVDINDIISVGVL